jgi:hypothetical protein
VLLPVPVVLLPLELELLPLVAGVVKLLALDNTLLTVPIKETQRAEWMIVRFGP